MKKSKRGPVCAICSTLGTTLLIILIIVCIPFTLPRLLDYQAYTVISGSMEPEIPVGAILVSRETDITELRIGDIVCFFSLESGRFGQIITHRIVNILLSEDGMVMLQTKGDANLVSDILYVTAENLIGKVIFYTGRGNAAAGVLSFLTSGMGFMTCLALPALLIAGLIMQESVSNMKRELAVAMYRMAFYLVVRMHISRFEKRLLKIIS